MDVKIGDLCWAKMKGFPPWPGKIIAAPQSEKYRYLHKKKLHHYVYFFGSGNYAWVSAANIKPNSEETIKQASKKRSIPLQKAIQQLKRDMPKNFVSQDLGEKYYRQGIIKPCIIAIKRLRIDTSQIKESNSFTLNELLSLGVCRHEILEPRRKIRKIDNSTSNEDSMEVDTDSKSTKCQEMALKKFGFIGLGELGKGIVKNLLKSKCDVTIWNQTSEEYGLNNEQRTADSFLSLIVTCDIILCCICSEDKAQSIFKGDMGILQSFATYQNEGKGLALLANVDLQVSAEIAASIQASGGRYMGAPLLGSETQAINGELLIVCSGDESLFDDCKTAFTSFKRVRYLGPDIELAPKIHTIIGLFLNSVSKSYKEARSLIQELKLSVQTFDDLLKTVLGESSLAALCHDSLEKKFSQEDRIRFFLEDLNLKTLLEANFPAPGFDMQKNFTKELA
ncbi:Putative oxidoreductase GLYR1 [Araneus ventricosus]|uniref:Oxidoreductase GLYR1 n=1 Tax=Araneus ventricosus TaxID=182803 RepID=A0A4Y2E1J7_ARAVE|nr:Putative oxidoreductase GLYR1 [Araneus ventricosus]